MTHKKTTMPIDKSNEGYFDEDQYFPQDSVGGVDNVTTNSATQINETFNDPTRISGYTDNARDFGGAGNDNSFI